MSDNKKYFEEVFASWPKAPLPGGVVGERGRTDLPPGTRGGENLTPDRHYEHKQHTFDCFCKKVLKCEAYSGYRQNSRRREHELSLSELPEETMEQLATYDRYPWDYTPFCIDGDVILIENEHLAGALNALPPEGRNILLMYYFLELADREIAERLHLARKTVNNRRLRTCRLLKELMGGEAD